MARQWRRRLHPETGVEHAQHLLLMRERWGGGEEGGWLTLAELISAVSQMQETLLKAHLWWRLRI